jgi:hypothetical protein
MLRERSDSSFMPRQRHLLQAPLGRALRGARHLRPQDAHLPVADNGKVERFIRTLLEIWAYACPTRTEGSARPS